MALSAIAGAGISPYGHPFSVVRLRGLLPREVPGDGLPYRFRKSTCPYSEQTGQFDRLGVDPPLRILDVRFVLLSSGVDNPRFPCAIQISGHSTGEQMSGYIRIFLRPSRNENETLLP